MIKLINGRGDLGKILKEKLEYYSYVYRDTCQKNVYIYHTWRIETKDEELKGARILETLKNRFGGAGHIAFLLLRKHGFKELAIVQNSNS